MTLKVAIGITFNLRLKRKIRVNNIPIFANHLILLL